MSREAGDLFGVDFDKMATIPPFLDALSTAIGQHVRPRVKAAHEAAHPKQHGVDCALGSMQIPVVQELSRALTGTHDAVDANTRDVAESLAASAKAVIKIAERYKTTEERNRAAAADVARLLLR